MRIGVSYMSHYNPKHIRTDLEEMKRIGLDDVLVAAQENDFVHFPGKLKFTPAIAKDLGIRPLAIFWGIFNCLGGGKSSQLLLEHPECFQVARDGGHLAAGCYVNPVSVSRAKEMVDTVVERGFEGYFIDEPKPLPLCFCPACRKKFDAWRGGDLAQAGADLQRAFRHYCVIDYVRDVSDYCKKTHPRLETLCCLMPSDRKVWAEAAALDSLDNLGTDLYWVNDDNDVEGMTPIVNELAGICRGGGKKHHEWLQLQRVKRGQEDRIRQQGAILVRERPDALYAWAYQAQLGVDEESEDWALCWSKALEVFRMAKDSE